MQVDVNDILRQGEGSLTDFVVDDETPELTDVTLAQPLAGNLRIMGTKSGVLVIGELQTAVELECNRCLRTFTHSLKLPLRAEFDRHPDEDSFPIDKKGQIDLDEPVRQELILHLPLQQLCKADCESLQLKEMKDSNGRS